MTPGNRKSFSELVVELNDALKTTSIPYAFSGAIALSYHSLNPRATDDIDVALSVGGSAAEHVFRSLPPGIKWTGQRLGMAQVNEQVRLKWHRGITVDLFFNFRDYDATIASRPEIVPFAATHIPIVSATDLVILKCTFDRGGDIAGKERDWTDIRNMIEAKTVDTAEAVKWVSAIAGEDSPELQKLRELIKSI